MNKIFRKMLIALFGCMSLSLSSCSLTPIDRVYKAELDCSSVSLDLGLKKKISVKSVTCDNKEITAYTCTFNSLDQDVATIDSDGYITAVGGGATFVYANINIPGVNKDISAQCSVTVNTPVADFEIIPNTLVLNLKGTKTFDLKAKYKGNETSSVSWKTNDFSIANVNSNGQVTGKKVGKTTITGTYTQDIKCVASCDVEVVSNEGKITSVEVNPSSASLDAAISETLQLNADVKGEGDYTKSVYWSSSNQNVAKVNYATGLVTAISKGTALITATSSSLEYPLTGTCLITVTDSHPVEISLNKTSAVVPQSRTLQLTATVSHAIDKSVSWSSNKTGVSVNNGLVSVSETVEVGTVAVITATSVEDNTKKATCTITVVEKPSYKYDYTLMFYMCASTLEHDGTKTYAYPALFSEDIKEILSVDLPSSVKVIIETGGTKKWDLGKTYLDGASAISADYLQRWEVANHKLKLVETLTTNYMAKQESYEEFLEWGLSDYSAEQIGVVISGHGAGIGGCAIDDNYTYTYSHMTYQHMLDTKEIAGATKDALVATGRDRLTWMGFDCCLMGSADIASVLSDYFDYMVCSQESELGEGWAHDVYMEELVKDPTVKPETLLPVIASSFVEFGHNNYCSSYEKCLQTLSVLDLSKMETFISEFNSYVTNTGFNSSAYNKYKTAFKYAYNKFGEGIYGLVDFKDYIVKLASQFSDIPTADLLTALDDLVIANSYCSRYTTKPCGLNAFFPESTDSYYSLQVGKDDYSGEDATKFSSYQGMCLSFGDWYW